mgnify:CR=1 FL=1
MFLYLSLTREPSETVNWFTPVAAIHAGLQMNGDLGVKTYAGDTMWSDFHEDLLRLGGTSTPAGNPERQIVPVGFGIQMTWATIMANLYRTRLGVYRYGQPLNKKWQEKDVVELARIFTQCAYEKDAVFDEKDAFSFMGMSDAYLSNDDRYVFGGDLFTKEEEQAAIGKYMTCMYDMHSRYLQIYGGK